MSVTLITAFFALLVTSPAPDTGCGPSKASPTICKVRDSVTPKELLRKFDETVRNRLCRAKPDRHYVRAQVTFIFDLDTMARRAAGSHWASWTEKYRDNYLKLFKNFVLKRYVGRLEKRKDYSVKFVSEKISGTKAVVKTSLNKKGANPDDAIEVTYRLEKRGQDWRVVDVVTDEVSLVDTYRSMFRDVLKRKGTQGLLDYLGGQTR